MRHRTRDNSTNLEYKFDAWDTQCLPGNDIHLATNLPTHWNGVREDMWDVETFQYNRKRRAGEVIINPMRSVKIESHCSYDGPSYHRDCSASANPSSNWNSIYTGPWFISAGGDFVLKNLFSDDDIRHQVSVAATKAWADAVKSEHELLVFLFELRKTISLLLNPLGNAQNFLNKLKKAKNADPKPGTKSLTLGQYLAREWLTWRYGWLQLKRDTESLTKAVGKDKYTGLINSRGLVKSSKEKVETVTVRAAATFDITCQITYVDELSVKAGIFHSASLGLDDFLGVKIENIPGAIWEVIPWSFVVDWVANVQDYLTALLPSSILPVKGKYHVIRRNKSVIVAPTSTTFRPGYDPKYSVTAGVVGTLVRRERTVVRIPDLPNPSLRLAPKISDFMDKRVLDALALIIQRLNRP